MSSILSTGNVHTVGGGVGVGVDVGPGVAVGAGVPVGVAVGPGVADGPGVGVGHLLRDRDCVNVPPGRVDRIVRAHPETEPDGLTTQIRTQIDYSINITAGITRPRETTRQRIAGSAANLTGVKASFKTTTHSCCCDVSKCPLS